MKNAPPEKVTEHPRKYDTQDEKRFLDHLGTHRHVSRRGWAPVTRKDLLEAYIVSAPERQRWGTIHPGAVLAHAQTLLKNLVARAQAPKEKRG